MRGFDYLLSPPNGATRHSTFSVRPRDLTGLGPRLRKDGVTPDTLHGACFISFVALQAGLATPEEVLGDYGLVHECAHVACFGPACSPGAATVEDLARMAEELERRIASVPLADIASQFRIGPDEHGRWEERST